MLGVNSYVLITPLDGSCPLLHVGETYLDDRRGLFEEALVGGEVLHSERGRHDDQFQGVAFLRTGTNKVLVNSR